MKAWNVIEMEKIAIYKILLFTNSSKFFASIISYLNLKLSCDLLN
jgi:hypothetical protein